VWKSRLARNVRTMTSVKEPWREREGDEGTCRFKVLEYQKKKMAEIHSIKAVCDRLSAETVIPARAVLMRELGRYGSETVYVVHCCEELLRRLGSETPLVFSNVDDRIIVSVIAAM
jgi:hypothetical protein